jgi:predicted dehydrogenase
VPWFVDDKLGGGPLIDGAIHNQDFAAWLFGDPQYVQASGIKIDSKVTAVDTATAIVHYANGSQLMLSWSWGSAPTPPMHDVLGPKAAMLFPSADAPAYYLITRDGKRRKVAHRPCKMVVNQAKHFVDCLEKGTKCLSPGTEAIKSVASAEAILKAARAGGSRKVSW